MVLSRHPINSTLERERERERERDTVRAKIAHSRCTLVHTDAR